MNKTAGNLLAVIVTLVLAFCVSWFGWGLRPVSWGWVIWGSIGAVFVGGLITALSDND